MKLALVRQQYTPFGGAERFVERTLAALCDSGVDVTMIARKWIGPAESNILQCNPFFLGRTWRDAGFARCVQKIIGQGRFDLVQSHERIPGCHIYRAGDGVHASWLELRAQARGKPAPIVKRLPMWHRYTLAAEADLYRHPNLKAVICNSRMVRDDIVRRFAVPAERLHVIYNGVDLDAFHPNLQTIHRARVRADLGVGDKVPLILFVGSGFERKGVPVLLKALSRMQTRNAMLLIVGYDRSFQQMRDIARKLGIDDHVHFLGSSQDPRSYYGAADLFCLPTLYDPMPNAAIEALACGLPVVTSTTCGAAELIEPGRNGLVCDARDADVLAGCLDQMSGRARPDPATVRASVEHLGLASMVAQLSTLYGSLMDAGALAK